MCTRSAEMRHSRSRVLLAEAAKLLPVAIRHAICIGREPPPQLVEHALINRNSITDRIGLGGLRCRSKHPGRERRGDKLSVRHFLNSIIGGVAAPMIERGAPVGNGPVPGFTIGISSLAPAA